MRFACHIVLTDTERAELEALAAVGSGNARLAQRARMILLAAAGWQNKDIAAEVGVGRIQVARWRDRYAVSRLAGIERDLPRGAPPVRMDVARLVALARDAEPGTLSARQFAAELGVSSACVSRHWRASGLPARPDRTAAAALPSGTADKLHAAEIVGLYLAAPEHAVAVAMEAGAPAGKPTFAVANQRNSAAFRRTMGVSFLTTLKMLDAATAPDSDAGRVGGWLAFLRRLAPHAPPGRQLLILADNPLSHEHPKVQEVLAGHRWTVRFVAGHAAWLRGVQALLRESSGGLPGSVAQVLAAVGQHEARRPFDWVRGADAALHCEVDVVGLVEPVDAADLAPAGHAWPMIDRGRAQAPIQPSPPPRATAQPVLSLVLHPAVPRVRPRTVEAVASAKLLPPRHVRKLLPRERLMSRLLDARRQRCVVIQGQAGAGKTSALMVWRKGLISLGFDVSWLALGVEDNAPARFFECLLASLAEADPAIARNAEALTGTGQDDNAIEHWVITLVQTLDQRERELVLMIDDLHHLTDTRIFRALQRLLDYAPPKLHLAFSSRSALPLALEALRAQRLLTEIDMHDLRFTPEESARFLHDQVGAVSTRDAAALHALTDGWVAGLQLFAVELRKRHGGDYPFARARDPHMFAAYFEREVLGLMASDDLAMLTRMAVCPHFRANLCAEMPGETDTPSRIAARLARLESDNQFITQVGSGDSEAWYRIHPLLRETLLARLEPADNGRIGDPDIACVTTEARALHAAAWRWFDRRGQLGDAVYHAVRAGEAAAAAAMVESSGHDLLKRGDLTQLLALMRRLPDDQVQSRFGLLALVAFLRLYMRDVDGLEQSLERLAVLCDRTDTVHPYVVCLLRAGRAVQLDDIDTIIGILPELWAIPPQADDLWWTCRSNVLSWYFLLRGEYKEARRLQSDTERRSNVPRSSMFGRYITAMSLAMEGEIQHAAKSARVVLREAERRGPAFLGLTCMAAGLLADILYELNDYDSACELLEPRIAMLERVSLPDVVLRAFTVLSRAYWLAGRRAQATACLDRLEAYAVRYRIDRLLAEALLLRLSRHLQLGETERANAVLQRVQQLAQRYAGQPGTVAAHVARIAAQAGIEMLLHTHDYANAAARLEARLILESEARPARSATLWLQTALARHAAGNSAGARAAFVRALRTGHGSGLIRTLLDATAGAAPSFAALIGEGLDDPVLAFYARRLPTAAITAAPAPPGTSAQAGAIAMLSEREREVLGLLAQAMSNKKIASVLNVSPETVKWHLKNIYVKLGVNGRGKAAARLRDLAPSQPGSALAV